MKVCPCCKKDFYARRCEIKKGGGIFCSMSCKIKYKADRSPWYEKRGNVSVHRIVMEDKIKRKLAKGETVHHIDGNKRNNNPENLILFSSHSEHMKHEFRTGGITVSHETAVSNGIKSGIARRLKKKTLFGCTGTQT